MVVGKCVSKENPKSNLDLDLGFVNSLILYRNGLKGGKTYWPDLAHIFNFFKGLKVCLSLKIVREWGCV